MYEYISGTLTEYSDDHAVIEASGVGYYLDIPASTARGLPGIGVAVRLLVHLYVREDMQRLYGFLTSEEREVFRQLLSINKVGPKVSLNILSGMSVSDLVKSVQNQDPTRFNAVSGIGPKTALRLVMELKGKLKIKTTARPPLSPSPRPGRGKGAEVDTVADVKADAYAAMLSLGYSEASVGEALMRVEEILEGTVAPVEEWIRKALQVI